MADRVPLVFRVALAVAVGVALSALIVAWQATSRLARVSQVDPRTFLQQRDRGHRFTVESYGFAYRGESGNLIDDEILMFGAFEKERLFFMRDFLAGLAGSGGPDAPVVIDVGANTGNHSLFLSRLSGTVHAFEPFPPVIQRFKDNLRLNPGIDNVVLHEVGLGDVDVTLPFVAPPANNQGMGTFRADAESARGGEVYETPLHIVVGDNWLADIDLTGLVLIKIDVEGFEEPVLLGLVRTLARHRPPRGRGGVATVARGYDRVVRATGWAAAGALRVPGLWPALSGGGLDWRLHPEATHQH